MDCVKVHFAPTRETYNIAHQCSKDLFRKIGELISNIKPLNSKNISEVEEIDVE